MVVLCAVKFLYQLLKVNTDSHYIAMYNSNGVHGVTPPPKQDIFALVVIFLSSFQVILSLPSSPLPAMHSLQHH